MARDRSQESLALERVVVDSQMAAIRMMELSVKILALIPAIAAVRFYLPAERTE